MKKISFFILFIAINFIAFAQDVKVSHNLPESLNAGQSFDMEVTLTKGNIGSFAKFQTDLPAGFTAASIDTKSGNFTFENQRVKIVWVSVPSDPVFTFKIKIGVPANAPSSCVIAAKFYYLENNVKKEYEIPAHTIKINSGSGEVSTTNTVTPTTTETTPTNTVTTTETTPTNTVTPETTPTNTVTATETTPTNTVTPETTPTNTVTATETKTETVPTNTVTATKTETASTTTSTAKARAGVIYKVQIGAFTNSPSKSKFPGVSVVIAEEGGMYKALSGSFNSEAEALKHRENLATKGFPGFIVVYENGVRVRK